jgi:hypothetical protein
VKDIVQWLGEAGLETKTVWEHGDLAIVRAERPT